MTNAGERTRDQAIRFYADPDSDLPLYYEVIPDDGPEAQRLREGGVEYCRCYSRLVPEGEGGFVEVRSMEALSTDKFEQARAGGWPPLTILQE